MAWRVLQHGDERAPRRSFGHPVSDHDWVGQFEDHSLGWVCAFEADAALVGLVNVPWDGAAHAFIMDTAVAERARQRGVGQQLVVVAAQHARAAGCEWLHVDFEGDALARFYFDACGFVPTTAGLIDLTRSAGVARAAGRAGRVVGSIHDLRSRRGRGHATEARERLLECS